MVDLQAPLDQPFLDISIGKGVAKIPANGAKNDLGSEVPLLEDGRSLEFCHSLSSVTAPSHVLATHPPKVPKLIPVAAA
jgi:hypothetical protein